MNLRPTDLAARLRGTLAGLAVAAHRSAAAAETGRWRLPLPLAVGLGEFLTERERWVLWLPALLGLGVGLYFVLASEPAGWIGGAWLAAAAVAVLLCRRQPGLQLAAIALLAIGAGFALAELRTERVAAPVLQQRLGPVWVSGRIVDIDRQRNGQRLTLDRLSIERLAAAATPVRIRVSFRTGNDALTIGDWVRARAVLTPPLAPVSPGGFDFARQAFYQGLGATGFAIGAARPQEPPDGAATDGLAERVANWLNGLRRTLTLRIFAQIEGASGGVAAALMTGDRSGIPEDVNQAMRDAGLAHLLSISGVHLSLVAGIVFFAVRLLLALIEPVALIYPTKKWAALIALLAIFVYFLLSGAAVSTERAFLMTAVVLLAVLLDRQALSMRLVAWAALAVLAWQPESLLDASFQMSFGAVVALIAAYELARGPIAARFARSGLPGRAGIYLAGACLTSLVGGFATEPFALYHFNRFVNFGLIANLLVEPLTGFWVMPWAVVAFVLMPFGLEGLALTPMGWGVDGIILVARTVAGLPGAVVLLPQMPDWGLLCCLGGGLWLCLWRRPWRLVGTAGLVLGVASIWLAARPDILIDGDARLVAVRDDDGRLLLSSGRADRIAAETWLRRDGTDQAATWPREGPAGEAALRCDSLGCIYRHAGQVVALPRDQAALAEDCRRADLVVSSVPVRGRCPGARQVIDRFDLWRRGAHAVYLLPDGAIRVETVAGDRGRRPWVIEPQSQHAQSVGTRPNGMPAAAPPGHSAADPDD